MESIMKKKCISSVILVSLCFLLTNHLSYAESDSTSLNEVKTSLSPAGNYRYVYAMLFKLYDAVLYTDAEQTTNINKILNGENALLLQFDYLRKIKKSIILESSEKLLVENMSPVELASIKDRVDRLNAVYRTVNKGDSLALSYIPDKGTTLWINGEPMITIEGKDFPQLYYRIWLGEKPASTEMRNALLERVFVQS